MSTERTRDRELDGIAQSAVERGAAPAAVVAVAFRDEQGFVVRTGAHGTGPDGEVHEESLFDLASVSKPFVAFALARAARRGLLTLSDASARWLSELSGSLTGRASLELLLAHRAGLEPHRPLFAPLCDKAPFDKRAALAQIALARRDDCLHEPPAEGYAPLYSDLGYALCGEALRRAANLELDEVVGSEVCGLLGLDAMSARLWLRADKHFVKRVLPTETVAWRGGVLRGTVHDENAWAMAGHGLAGQAGLFGTAASVARFGASVLDAMAGRRLDWLKPTEVLPMVRKRPGGTLRAGFDGKSGLQSAAGMVSHRDTFGHLGFTGTSFWCDPVAELVTVLLTNRVCPTRENHRIREARPAVHDALFRYASRRGLPSESKP